MKKILVVVDMQNDFLTGSLANESAVKIIPNIKNEILCGNYDHIIFTRDTHDEDYLNSQEGKKLPVVHCIENTNGWNVCDELLDAAKSMPYSFYDKHTFGARNWTECFISDIDWGDTNINNCDITLVGTCTDICVVSNALRLKTEFSESNVNVIANCCAPLFGDANRQESALTVMESCQVNVIR